MKRHKTSAADSKLEANSTLASISRRVFLAEAAAAIAVGPTLLRASLREPAVPAILHLATPSSRAGHIHTFALTSVSCKVLGSTAIDDFAAFAVHPVLPILYVARDCRHWNGLPSGVVETYVVRRSARPLQLMAQTPMALSATGPRSLAVSSCGHHLLVSASTGGAWNSFALDSAGMPASVGIARKETGIAQNPHDVLLPTPHGLAFSPCTLLAAGTDLGNKRLTLLQPSADGIAVLDRCPVPSGLAAVPPVWTVDGRYILAAAAHIASLLLYRVRDTQAAGHNAAIHLLHIVPTATPVTALLPHPSNPAVFTSRIKGTGSVLELWEIQGDRLQRTNSKSVPDRIQALTHDGNGLWTASDDRLARIFVHDLHTTSFEMRLRMDGVQAIVSQKLAV